MTAHTEQLDENASERLFPSLANPNWLVLRARRRLFENWLAHLRPDRMAIVDVGGRIQPYRPLLKERVLCYVAVDLVKTRDVDVLARAEELPIADGVFDLAICTQVLEYVHRPEAVISEIRRVLKPGGVLLLSVPAVYPADSDQDYWRFQRPGLTLLLSSFADVEIRPEGSSITGLFRTVAVWSCFFIKPAFLNKLMRYTWVPLLNITARGLEKLVRSSNDQFTANFSVRAQK